MLALSKCNNMEDPPPANDATGTILHPLHFSVNIIRAASLPVSVP